MTKQEQNQNLVKITETQHMLVGFKEKYNKENLPTADHKEGYTFLKTGIAELRTLRGRTEDHRKVIVSPLNEKVREVNALAKDVIAELADIEQPMKELKAVEDDRRAEVKAEKDRIEQARINAITKRIVMINDSPIRLIDSSPEEIQVEIDELMGLDPETEFDEFLNTASDAIDTSLTRLRSLKEKAEQAIELHKIKEAEEAKRQAQEQAQKEAEEAQRVKEQAELAELRKEKAEREEAHKKEDEEIARLYAEKEAKAIFEGECVNDLTEQMAHDLDPEVCEAPPTAPEMKQDLVELDEIQDDISGMKEQSIDFLADCIGRSTQSGSLNASALAQIIFQAIFIGNIPHITFDIQPN